MGIGIMIYLLLAGVMSILALLYLEFSAMQAFGITALVPLFMLGILFTLRKKIKCHPDATNIYEMNEIGETVDIAVPFIFENGSPFFPLSKGMLILAYKNEFTGETGRLKFAFSVDALTKTKKELHLPVKHCGTITMQIRKVTIYDYLGLFRFTIIKSGKENTFSLLPPLQEVYINEAVFTGEGDYESGRYSPYKPGDDPSEIFAIRDFKEGDKFQQVHWKLSMKKSKLMIKEFSFPLAQSTTIFVDFCIQGKNGLDQVDQLIQGVYSVSNALLERQIPLRFYWYDNLAKVIKTNLVTSGEEFLWTLQEMFTAHFTEDEEELIVSYLKWGQGKSHATGLYLTTTDGRAAEGADLNVSKLYLVNVSAGVLGGGGIGE